MYRDHIDIYCERVGPEFWAEPLNAVSNVAIIIAALLLIPVLRRETSGAIRDPAHWLLIGLVFLIGVGSGLFHTFAVRWAMWADVIPITLFTIVYAYFALQRFLQLSVPISLLWTAVMLALTLGLPVGTGLQGSTYLPALVGMLVAGFLLHRRERRSRSGNALLVSGCLFALALSFRTLDGPLCDTFPNGTHFLWHLLDGVALFILTRAMIQFSQLRALD